MSKLDIRCTNRLAPHCCPRHFWSSVHSVPNDLDWCAAPTRLYTFILPSWKNSFIAENLSKEISEFFFFFYLMRLGESDLVIDFSSICIDCSFGHNAGLVKLRTRYIGTLLYSLYCRFILTDLHPQGQDLGADGGNADRTGARTTQYGRVIIPALHSFVPARESFVMCDPVWPFSDLYRLVCVFGGRWSLFGEKCNLITPHCRLLQDNLGSILMTSKQDEQALVRLFE